MSKYIVISENLQAATTTNRVLSSTENRSRRGRKPYRIQKCAAAVLNFNIEMHLNYEIHVCTKGRSCACTVHSYIVVTVIDKYQYSISNNEENNTIYPPTPSIMLENICIKCSETSMI